MNSLAKTLIISLTTLIIIAIIAVVFIFYINNDTASGEEDGELSIDDLNDYSYVTPEVTTDLLDGRFVRIQFQLITDGRKSLNEVEQREFQIQNLIIKELSVMTENDFNEGLADLENTMQAELNELMTDGEIIDVYTINKIMQ